LNQNNALTYQVSCYQISEEQNRSRYQAKLRKS